MDVDHQMKTKLGRYSTATSTIALTRICQKLTELIDSTNGLLEELLAVKCINLEQRQRIDALDSCISKKYSSVRDTDEKKYR
jgi:hypothetical protein